jgi:aspartyl-tRNA(Asn)/glutamyl-tRNA(Gln) amidotransferase subunit A
MARTNSLTRRDFLATGLAASAWPAASAMVTGRAATGTPPPAAPPNPSDLAGLTLRQAAGLVRSRSASPVELTRACLTRIEALNPKINAFITVTRELAESAAREMEAEQRRGHWRGPLHGVPIALKDNIDTAGVRTTGASELFKDRVPDADAEVVRRLKDAGAILLGKLNLHEFAYGGTSAVTYYGPVHNPWALDRQAGGSSGGPAAALAADLCFASLGTDTAGSVRIPGSYCGIVGFKPTYGRVSNRGVIPLSWTLDHTGPMTKNVEDAALLLGVIAGFDPQDPVSADMPVPDYTKAPGSPTARLRLGVPRTPFFDNLDPDVAKAVETAIGVLRGLVASVRDVELPPSGTPALVWGPEIHAYHSKWIAESPAKYQAATRAAIERDGLIPGWQHAQARREVDIARREIRKVFATVDLLVTPTMKVPAPPLPAPIPPGNEAGRGRGGAAATGGGGNTAPFDVYGLPTISVPCGFSSAGLPIGLQISGAHWAESTVLTLAHAYERAAGWHGKKVPAIA